MTEAETVVEYTDYDDEEGTVEHVKIIRTDDPEYPSGWKYRLHYGTLDGETIVRYDNSHEKQRGHDRHVGDRTESVEFTTMQEIYRRFLEDVEKLR